MVSLTPYQMLLVGVVLGGVARIPLIYLLTFQVKESFFVWCCFCGCF